MTINIIERRAALYDRLIDLPPLLSAKHPLGLVALPDYSPHNTHKIIKYLSRALAKERQAGRRRAWIYCPKRHLDLAVALKGEKNNLQAEKAHAVKNTPIRDVH